ncbi:hypothetical protein AB32_5307 [Escherichia coli 2-316-03_S1_C2]|nr:hypothetical protein ECP03019043_5174 [Escherichia coli P0301904.3]ESS99759.1 hypothetical protein L343_0166 [Escherichia coli CE549]EZK03258.1 hypothetical protein AB72_5120 [Escherichia coli 1-250-04_S1_C3]EZK08034.1 hypothetical protein AB53_5314 [Escherichia coli 2-005-03_S1_C3]EZK22935.1 hypothetical protein AB25_5311 [Escherichia coli 2-005-03_S1_C2]EZK35228.1 hypothetical protein AA97_5075 [Escherichia coli 2-005-03_S1_C1]KDA60756.1 hypothetical protein AA99_5185 [Escherichia coli 2
MAAVSSPSAPAKSGVGISFLKTVTGDFSMTTILVPDCDLLDLLFVSL